MQDQKDRTVVSGAVFADAESGRPVRLHRAGRRVVRLFHGAQSDPQGDCGEPPSGGGDLDAQRGVQALRGSVHGGAGVYQDRPRRHRRGVVL